MADGVRPPHEGPHEDRLVGGGVPNDMRIGPAEDAAAEDQQRGERIEDERSHGLRPTRGAAHRTILSLSEAQRHGGGRAEATRRAWWEVSAVDDEVG